VRPREQAAEAARIELAETLPRALTAAQQAVAAETQVASVRQQADSMLAEGRAALDRGNAEAARAAVSELDRLAALLRQEYVLRIAGRPQDQTGFFREHPKFGGRAYFVVVDAVDRAGNPVQLPIRNDETNRTDTVSRFAVRVPYETFESVRNDKARNGIVQNARMAEKRRGVLDPEFRMPALEGRITRW
jgi:multidrug efflux pump subunit AcrA (membrane-fusion protein)